MAKEGAIRLVWLCPEIGEAPAVVWLPVRGGLHAKAVAHPWHVLTVNDSETLIKRLVAVYANWAQEGDISAHRPCPAQGCDCRFRHRHGAGVEGAAAVGSRCDLHHVMVDRVSAGVVSGRGGTTVAYGRPRHDFRPHPAPLPATVPS